MNSKKNLITALILQVATILQGLILPRLIITTFGSDVNGLISSVTQFLSFISLLEGGLGAVVLAELYAPMEVDDKVKIKSVLLACQCFFNKLALIFAVYTIILSIVYPLFLAKDFEFGYVCTLVLILSLTTIVQYLFSITNKLLLQASQRVFVVNIVMSITVGLNLLVSVLLIKVFPEIHAVKLAAAFVFLLQPIVFNHCIPKDYKIRTLHNPQSRYILKNRWSGFAQNLAYFINMNTDVAVVTLFLGLANVSVYSIYMLAINALRSIIVSAMSSYQSVLGKYYAMGDFDILRKKFEEFEKSFFIISIILFSTCLLLVNGFVEIYTTGVNDIEYYQPIFAAVIVLANLIYCVREPYRLLVLSAGKFKETNMGSIVEALLNIIISVLLVSRLELAGIAIGTLIAVTYRMLSFIWYLKNDVLFFKYARYVKLFLMLVGIVALNLYLYASHPFVIGNFGQFFAFGTATVVGETALTFLIYKICIFCQKTIQRIHITGGKK